MENKSLIFIVAYEAEAHLGELFDRILKSELDATHDILLIDDASKDYTFTIARKLAASVHSRVTILRNPTNLGYGGNQKLGYEYAIREGYEVVVLLHGDCQYPPEFVSSMTQPILSGDCDVVFGSRMLDKKRALQGGMPLYKWVGNQATTRIQNWLLGSSLSECHTGLRAYRVKLLEQIPFRYNSNSFHFDADIIIQCHRVGARFAEIAIPTRYGSEICRVNGIKYCWNCFKSGLADRCTQMEVFYSRKFDLKKEPTYMSKMGIDGSSHELVSQLVPQGSTVLDLGGGNGVMARELRKKGCTITVVDERPSIENADGINVITEKCEKLDPIPQADVVLLLDVVEHMGRKDQFVLLERIRAMGGTRGTRVILSVPNSVFLPVRLMMLLGRINYGRRGILDETHTFLFTKHSIRSLLVSAGYKISRVQYSSAPFTFAFPRAFQVAKALSKLQAKCARVWPSLFAYQIIIEAQPTPNVVALLQAAEGASNSVKGGNSRPLCMR